MKLDADDANRLLSLIGNLHDAGTTGEIAVVCREGLAAAVPADICDLVVLAGGQPQEDRYFGTPDGYTADEIQAVLAAGFDHPVVARYVTHGDRGPCSVSDVLPLDRWRDTAYCIVAGKRDAEIASVLGIRPATATTHVRNLLGKLGVESRLVAAMTAIGTVQTRA